MLTRGAFEDPEFIKCSQWLDKFRTEYQRVIVNDLWYNAPIEQFQQKHAPAKAGVGTGFALGIASKRESRAFQAIQSSPETL